MASFRTHLSLSGLLGIGYGGAAYAIYDVRPQSCALAAVLLGLSGLAPDLDANKGVPLRESMALLAAVVPMVLVERLQACGLAIESIILIGGLLYLSIRFVGAGLVRRYTVHRGMLHSLPAAAIAGELAFLLAPGGTGQRIYYAAAVLAGYLGHLLLDELASLHMRRGRLRLKRSAFTALKPLGGKWWPNLIALSILAGLSYLVIESMELADTFPVPWPR